MNFKDKNVVTTSFCYSRKGNEYNGKVLNYLWHCQTENKSTFKYFGFEKKKKSLLNSNIK